MPDHEESVSIARNDPRWVSAPIRAAIVLLSLSWLVQSCGFGAPSSPSPVDLPFLPGLHLFELTGADLSDDPALPPCVPFGVPYDGKMVETALTLEKDATEWVGRSSSAQAGNIVLRFHGTGSTGPGQTGTSGTIQGMAWDMPMRSPMKGARDVGVSFMGSGDSPLAIFTGVVYVPNGAISFGTITGNIVFTDHAGATS